jgi:hypothetical protein
MEARGIYTNTSINLAGGDGLRTDGITAIAAGNMHARLQPVM